MKKTAIISIFTVAALLSGCGSKFAESLGLGGDNGCDEGGSGFHLVESSGTWTTGGDGTSDGYIDEGGGYVEDTSSDDGCRSDKAEAGVSSGSPAVAYDDAAMEGSVADGMVIGETPGSAGSGNGQIGWGILTAGNFDDSINMDAFRRFWLTDDSQVPDWQKEGPVELPDIDSIQVAARYENPVPAAMDLSLVIDATGSMSDELEYIKAELQYISSTINERFPDVAQRYSLIVYRDEGDAYVSQGIDLQGDLSVFQEFLDKQRAGGGGDYPEAMHVALAEAASRLQWGGDDTARLLFLIADAPPHAQHVPATLEAVDSLAAKGVHVYPVAASGVADLAERVMRVAALQTGGEYVFITDDSGVGSSHAEPHIPCYNVQKLNELMIQLITAELQQERIEPDAANVIRTVGNPVDGVCVVEQ